MRVEIYEGFQKIPSDQVCVCFQDAHEFFCSLIDHIQEEVSSLLKKQSVNRADCPELGSICPTTYSFRFVCISGSSYLFEVCL
jgi:hypothetical protein